MDLQNVPFAGSLIVMATTRDVVGEAGFDLTFPEGATIWMPAAQFQASFRVNGAMRFGDALEYLKRGNRMARDEWAGTFLIATENGIGIGTEVEEPAPWAPAVADLLAEDWRLVP